MDELIAFLLGEAPLDGVWFGEDHPERPGSFWWRQDLREAWNRRAMPANPVAHVTGYFDGHCVVAPLNTAALLPVGMALFSNAAPQVPVDGLNTVICPCCGEGLPPENFGCPHCGYEDNEHGRILTIAEMASLSSYPDQGSERFNDVSPKFIRALIAAARTAPVIDRDAVIEECATLMDEMKEQSRDARFRSALTIAAGGLRALKQSPATDDGMAVNAKVSGAGTASAGLPG